MYWLGLGSGCWWLGVSPLAGNRCLWARLSLCAALQLGLGNLPAHGRCAPCDSVLFVLLRARPIRSLAFSVGAPVGTGGALQLVPGALLGMAHFVHIWRGMAVAVASRQSRFHHPRLSGSPFVGSGGAIQPRALRMAGANSDRDVVVAAAISLGSKLPLLAGCRVPGHHPSVVDFSPHPFHFDTPLPPQSGLT